MQSRYFVVSSLILVSLLASCTANTNIQPVGTNPPATSESLQPTSTKSLEEYRLKVGAPTIIALTAAAQTQAALSIPAADCPLTTSETISFEAPEPFSPTAPWEGMFWYGSDGLWTVLQANGVWDGLPHNPEGYTQKIVWWSHRFNLQDEQQPALVVSGHRLDAAAEPLRFYGATNAISEEIGEAMLTGVDFPSLGCWEITGQYKNASLTFVVWVAPEG